MAKNLIEEKNNTENSNSSSFKDAFEYKIIYVFEINNSSVHNGLIKIGDTTLHTNLSLDRLSPLSSELNKAAKERINSYTKTAGLTYNLLWTELAIKTVKQENKKTESQAFRDYQVHEVLKNSGINPIILGDSKEWFAIDLETARKAITAVKSNLGNLGNTHNKVTHTPIILRPEQEQCINKVIKHFKKADKFLINAKMRFGKTFTSLEIIKRCKFQKTIILTHRPVVDDGWYDDFTKVFYNTDYVYGSKAKGNTLEQLIDSGKNFIYFASVQDLRGSVQVGGKFEKNNLVFRTVWDCLIVDEAHEGTTTTLGEDTVKSVFKEGSGTKFIALSGTPFNILQDYDEESIYTWDYIMEQECKSEWDKLHFGDSNPYEELPELRIYTYDLGDVLKNSDYITFEDKAFNFHEFFRVFTGNMNEDYVTMPATAKVGDFVHERDVWSFLNMMTTESATNCYPYSNEEYRNLFKHSLWMVPGVKEAQALSKLMMKHPVFGNGMFEIVNVAGSGDEDEKEKDPLKLVREAIKNSGEDNYTITLSCGKLTTGVTVKEWTAVFMLAGSYSTSASSYLQTIFRVQSPCNKYGKIKETAYVFDFAPDRTLKMVASAVSVSSRAGKTKKDDIPQMGKFLNYCPVISVSGSEMKEYSATRLLQQLKKAYADKVVRNGFDDTNLYNDELFKLQEVDITRFKDLERIIGQTKALPKTNEIVINAQGLTNEQYEEIERLQKKKKKELTPEEKARLEEIKNLRDLRNNAISILRGISIRMPLLIFGADVPYDEEITLDKFVDAVDESSWEEFMPKGVTKEKFREFQKYYDEEIFIAAGRRIRNITREADTLDPIERVKKIAGLFSYFKNPDKETVLTPWRTVNMHMSDCLGGWCFWDEKFQAELDSPRYVDKSVITDKTFNKKDCKLLEINSKTGLYPLYLAFSCYNSQLKLIPNEPISLIQKKELWYRVLQNNIFVICKTPMARAITKRTLLGFSNYKVNAHCFDDLVNTMQNKTDQFKKRIVRGNFWGKGAEVKMKFDAIVGNPPYQIMDGGTKTSATPIYHYFVLTSKSLEPQFISMITPSRWFIGGKGLDEYRKDMLNDKRLSKIYDYPSTNDVFPSVDIAGGVSYFLWEKEHNGDCEIYNYANNETDKSIRNLNDFDVLPRFNKALPIIRKILALHTGQYLSEIASPSKPFGIRGGYKPKESGIPCQFKQKIGLSFADPNDVVDKYNLLDKWKFLAPYHAIAGQTDFTKPIGFYYEGNTKIIPPGTCCTETYIVLFSSNTKEEVESFKSYIFTKIARFLLLQCVISQDIANDKFKFVPHLGSYEGVYTDEILRKKWNITEEEWKYIDSKIINIKGK